MVASPFPVHLAEDPTHPAVKNMFRLCDKTSDARRIQCACVDEYVN